MSASGDQIIKSFVHAYSAERHGHQVQVAGYDKADPKAIARMMARKQHAQHVQLMIPFASVGAHPSDAVDHPMVSARAAMPNPDEVGRRVPKPKAEVLPAEEQKARKGAVAKQERLQRRALYEAAHEQIQMARHYEKVAEKAPQAETKAHYNDLARTIRTRLEGELGADYERQLEDRLVRNYSPEITQEVSDWAHKLGLTVTRDGNGHPTGNFGQLVAEGMGKAYEVIHRHSADMRTSLIKHVRSQVQQHMFRHWRDALGVESGALSQRQTHMLAKMSRYQHLTFAASGQMPKDHDIAAHLGVTADEVRTLKQLQQEVYAAHLDARSRGETDSATLGDTTPSSALTPEEQAEQNETITAVHEAIASLNSPLKRAAVLLKYGMDLDMGTEHELIDQEKLAQLAQANRESRAELGPEADADAVAQLAVSKVEDAPDHERALQAAKNLLEFDNDPHELLTRPKVTAEGLAAVRYSELLERLGYPKGNSGGLLREALKQVAKHPKILALQDVMQKSLAAGWGFPEATLLGDLSVMFGEDLPHWQQDQLVKSLAGTPDEAISDIICSITENDPDTGALRVRADRRDEAAILLAAFPQSGASHAEVQGDRGGRPLSVGEQEEQA